MDLFRMVVDVLVVLSGFVSGAVFIPQIRLLFQTKKSDNLSLGTVWGSFLLQSLIITQAVLKENWSLAFMMTMNGVFLGYVIFLIYYYRRFPGGKAAIVACH